ncbi:TonB-dependent receptor domain-containing protein [Phenylobacterium sp.]|uniref:TonB-dependent receptor domain-containing protein n=1 Tax=Phenylobacterium sp. TaxID=1871053 RepID=UPI003983D8A1
MAQAPAALAQQPPATPRPAPARPAAPATVEGVTVTGQSQGFRSSIDRRSYGVATDLQATSGSIGDALRNIPSVEVDVQGNVSLRGDANVTIMIDGKPSGMFRGEGRAQALQALPADQIERVEVITNPSAAFKPDGAAGIINLVTKTVRKPGRSGSMRASIGSAGRHNAGISGAYNSRKLTLSGDAGFRHDSQKQGGRDQRERLDPVTGQFVESIQTFANASAVDSRNARVTLDYDPDLKTRLGVELRHNGVDFAPLTFETFQVGGVSPRGYDRLGRVRIGRDNTEASANYRRKFAGDDHQLVVDLSREKTEENRSRRTTTLNRRPAGPEAFEDLGGRNILWRSEFKADYSRPMPGEAKLKAGYELDVDDNDYDSFGARGVSSGGPLTPDLTLANRFLFAQTIHTVFGTYERPFGDFTVLAGLRIEDVRIDIDQVTTALKAENNYARVHPSLHLAYKLSDARQVSASYSHRLQRPRPEDYNPFRFYQDPQNFRSGNPALKPQETHSFEGGYQYRKDGTFYLATLYYRQSQDQVTDVVRDIGAGVFLTTRENLGESRSGGVELVANGRLSKQLTYNVSGNAFWNEIDASRLGFAEPRSAVSLSGRANLNWQVTPKDFVQVNANLHGKRLTPQGYNEPFGMLNLGYRRKISDALSLTVSVQDALDTFRDSQVIDTPVLRQNVRREIDFRAVFVGLTYSFGGGPRPREPGFEFSAGGAPGGQ